MNKIKYAMGVFVLLAMSAPPVFSQEDQSQPQQPPTPPPPFCENNRGFYDWDFWVGDWNVYSNDEKRLFAGTNSVTKHYNNCLIIENWTNAKGGGGLSMNYYNPVTDKWRQVWVSNGYSIDYSGGLNDQGEMILVGELFTYQTGARQKFKGKWTSVDNGDVIQHFDIHDPKEDTWKVWFEGRYVRKENDANPPEAK